GGGGASAFAPRACPELVEGAAAPCGVVAAGSGGAGAPGGTAGSLGGVCGEGAAGVVVAPGAAPRAPRPRPRPGAGSTWYAILAESGENVPLVAFSTATS